MRNSTRKFAVVVALAATFHVAMGISGAFPKLQPSLAPALQTFVQAYRLVTGTNYSFGFFAPTIGTEVRVVFFLRDENGVLIAETTLRDQVKHEAKLRMIGVVHALKDPTFVSDERRSLLSSFASHVLAQHPRATHAQVQVQKYNLPTMHEYKRGERPRWNDIYQVEFRRS